jgi:hypothetical protein
VRVRICLEPELVRALDAASDKLSEQGAPGTGRGDVAAAVIRAWARKVEHHRDARTVR